MESDTERETLYDTLYMQSLRRNPQMNLFTEQKQTHTLGEQTNGYPGKALEEEIGSLGGYVHSAAFKMGN